MHEVSILPCADGELYIGETHDLVWRVDRHNDGWASRFTRSRRRTKLAVDAIPAAPGAEVEKYGARANEHIGARRRVITSER